ncbi:unnamed protein product [Owenia fusiformis]|uniref:Biogenesis of lysosome-related organelles complex 1 subunit 5 n=1 Tax=Owenia fusiformis TaxID=6347 RepID=A0A8J1YAE8_OWEFU|nr:unnamed protein product [Owenia fusiformis]
MAAEAISKDVGEIYSRLFDHKPVIQGEINYFIKEFEEKRQDREVERLHKMAYHMEELNNKVMPECHNNMEKYLGDIEAKIKAATYMCNKVTEKEAALNSDELLKSSRAARVKEWSEFIEEMCEKSKAVDDNHEEQAQKLLNHYKELEENLHIVPSPYGTPSK